MPELVPMTIVRLLSLVSWIGEHDGLPTAEVARHFGRTNKQIRRDVEALGEIRDSIPGSSFEIDWNLYATEDRLSIRTTLGADLPPRLTKAEATAILFGLHALADTLDDDLRARLPRTAMAVRSLAPGIGDESAVLHSGGTAHDAALDPLLDATARSRVVTFDYRSVNGRRSHRRVHPWRVRLTSSGWILEGWCETAGAARDFSLTGMSEVEVSEQTATVREKGVDGPRTAPVRQITVRPTGRWAADDFAVVFERADAEDTFTMGLEVWNEAWFQTLLIDLAPALVDAPADAMAGAGRRARAILDAWDAFDSEEVR